MAKISNTLVSQPIVQQFQSIQLIVTPDKTHDFLMTTENVAKGYGVSVKSILSHKYRQNSEILENTHFLSLLQNAGVNKMTIKKLLWTKRGVIRLGMFIKSQRAIKFRDWAENLIIGLTNPKKLNYSEGNKDLKGGYLHPFKAINHLTIKNASNGKKTPVSAFGNGAGSYPFRAIVNTGAFLSNKQESLQISKRRTAMPNNSIQSHSIQNFQHPQFGKLGLITIKGQEWFKLVDICKTLNLSNSTIVAGQVDGDERAKLSLGRQGKTWFVNESGLYSLILRSDKSNAKSFRKWITSEVIPSIRKTGEYKASLCSSMVAIPPVITTNHWEDTEKEGVYRYLPGNGNAYLLPTSRFRVDNEFATEEAIENFLREDFLKIKHILETKLWLNAFDHGGIKIHDNGTRLYSTVAAGEYIQKLLKY